MIFGAEGALGKGVTKTMLRKNYDKIYLYDFKFGDDADDKNNSVEKISVEDLSSEKNVSDLFGEFKPADDTLYFLYSTIGGFAGGNTIRETGEDEWNKMMDMNLKANFFIAKYFARLVEKSAGGSICFTAAETGITPEAQKAAYGTSKSALIHLVRTLSLEGQTINLSANAIAPYILDTPANRGWMKDADYDKWMKPEEIGELADSIFNNFHFISGNVIRLKSRFVVEQ